MIEQFTFLLFPMGQWASESVIVFGLPFQCSMQDNFSWTLGLQQTEALNPNRMIVNKSGRPKGGRLPMSGSSLVDQVKNLCMLSHDKSRICISIIQRVLINSQCKLKKRRDTWKRTESMKGRMEPKSMPYTSSLPNLLIHTLAHFGERKGTR